MYIILWLFFGAFIGWLASLLTNKNHKMRFTLNIIVGVIGSALGMWLMVVLDLGLPDTFSLEGFLISVCGAVLLLLILSAFKRK